MGLLIETRATPTALADGSSDAELNWGIPFTDAVVDQLGDRVGEPVEALLELGAVEREEDVEDMLRGVGVADRKVGLHEVDARGGPVAQRVVPRGDELDDLGDVPGRAEVARDRHEDVRAVARRRQHLLVDQHRAREVLALELLPGGDQAGRYPGDRRVKGRRGRGGTAPGGGWGGFARQSVEEAH
jgi:hypothetical protein